MYMKPTLPAGGAFFSTHAMTQSTEFLSMHIGSGPGVAGLSGMQVNPLVPLRSVRILPSASIAMMVASFATLAGAAFIALAMSSLSPGPFFASAAWALVVTASAALTISAPVT